VGIHNKHEQTFVLVFSSPLKDDWYLRESVALASGEERVRFDWSLIVSAGFGCEEVAHDNHCSWLDGNGANCNNSVLDVVSDESADE